MQQNLNAKYIKFLSDDEEKSKILASELSVPQAEFDAVWSWFLLLLQRQSKLDVYGDDVIIKDLASQLETLAASLSQSAQNFVLAKLIYYNNIIQSGHLDSWICGIMSKFLYDEIERRISEASFCLAEFTALTRYIKHNFYVSANGYLLENTLKIEKQNKIFARADDDAKLEIIQNLLYIIDDKEFHRDIAVFKKLACEVKDGDERGVRLFKNFIPKNRQGCYLVVNKILNAACFDGKFSLSVKALKWLDSARGAAAPSGWQNKFNELKGELGEEALAAVAAEILGLDSLTYHDFAVSSWSDDVVKRFVKSAEWILQIAGEQRLRTL